MLAECEGCIRGTRTSNAQSVLGPSGYVAAGNFPYRPPAPYSYALHREGSRRGFVSPVLYFNIGASRTNPPLLTIAKTGRLRSRARALKNLD